MTLETTTTNAKGKIMTLEQAQEKINGMRWKIDGVDGTLRVERINGMTEFVHYPSAAGKRSKRYQETRRKLGDDFTTTITADEDEMMRVFAAVSE